VPHTAVNGTRRLRGPLQLTVGPQIFSEFLGPQIYALTTLLTGPWFCLQATSHKALKRTQSTYADPRKSIDVVLESDHWLGSDSRPYFRLGLRTLDSDWVDLTISLESHPQDLVVPWFTN